mmetsp:Transcript_30609/g.65081  ORF Transcript_30609/g.65081 Transcript_30609/m.65081 type:complete len:223 (-) Transcript_30609:40-708(-)
MYHNTANKSSRIPFLPPVAGISSVRGRQLAKGCANSCNRTMLPSAHLARSNPPLLRPFQRAARRAPSTKIRPSLFYANTYLPIHLRITFESVCISQLHLPHTTMHLFDHFTAFSTLGVVFESHIYRASQRAPRSHNLNILIGVRDATTRTGQLLHRCTCLCGENSHLGPRVHAMSVTVARPMFHPCRFQVKYWLVVHATYKRVNSEAEEVVCVSAWVLWSRS